MLEDITPFLREQLARLSSENKQLKAQVSQSKPHRKFLCILDPDPSIIKLK
jgi:hypothetical protein